MSDFTPPIPSPPSPELEPALAWMRNMPAGRKPSGQGRRSSPMSWRWGDRLVLAAAWIAGISLCVIAAAIVLYMGYRGIQFLRPSLIFSRPQVSADQAGSGGFLDPLLGTMLLTLIGIVLALPLALSAAVWITEYGRPSWLARVIESSIEIVAGTPDIVIAIFGLALFQLSLLAPFSFTAEGGGVYGNSFFAAGAMMSLLALPPIYAATRDGLQSVPGHQREAAFALGKTRITTIRRVLLPSVRSNIATGATLGISRIIGSTAIVLLLLGSTLRIETQGSFPGIDLLRGTGSSLTSYIYENSPAGEGGAPQKAYAAAFVLLIFVLVLNLVVDRIGRAQASATGITPVGAVV
jgi:phosphate transport system permease protein